MMYKTGESRFYFYMKKLLLLILFITSPLYAQINREWVQRYNGTASSYDIVNDIIPDAEGNVFVYGTSFNEGTATDITIVKYGVSGNIIWEKKFNFGENSYDQVRAVYKDNMNNSYLCGLTTEGTNDNKMITLKVDGQGNLSWSKIFTKQNYGNLAAKDIEVVQGSVIVLGDAVFSSGRKDQFLLRYDLSGNFIWDKVYPMGASSSMEAVTLACIDTNSINTGSIFYYTPQSGGEMCFMTHKSDESLPWVVYIPEPTNGERFIKLIKANDNSLIYLGTKVSSNNVDFRIGRMLMKSGPFILWQNFFNGSGNHYDFPFDVCVDNENNILVTGSSRHGDPLGTEDIVTLKYNPAGDLLWSRIYNSDSNGMDQGMSITTDAQGNVYVGGASDLGSVRLGYKILKYSPSGNLLWKDNYSYAHHPEDFVYSIRTNTNNDIFVTGISFNPGTDYDFATIKYSQSVNVENISGNIPDKFYLSQNYPNPFNPVTNIEFSITDLSNVSLKVFDINGREIGTLHNGRLNAGNYKVQWNSGRLPSGVYFYELKSNNFKEVKKMLLIK